MGQLKIKEEELNFDERGLIPVIIQDSKTKEILMLGYMNQEALRKTLDTKEVWFWSRSRQELWHKGVTSGNYLILENISVDCDNDTLLILANPQGPTCHTGAYSCFTGITSSSTGNKLETMLKLEQVILQRKTEMPEKSYTTYLFSKGVDKILKKVGEETAEVIIAAKNNSKEELTYELADLVYHCLVLMTEQGIRVEDVVSELDKRK